MMNKGKNKNKPEKILLLLTIHRSISFPPFAQSQTKGAGRAVDLIATSKDKPMEPVAQARNNSCLHYYHQKND
jgi:hypothetical protein